METKKIKTEMTFKQLSWPLKVAIIGGWGYAVTFAIGFLIGFIEA